MCPLLCFCFDVTRAESRVFVVARLVNAISVSNGGVYFLSRKIKEIVAFLIVVGRFVAPESGRQKLSLDAVTVEDELLTWSFVLCGVI